MSRTAPVELAVAARIELPEGVETLDAVPVVAEPEGWIVVIS